MTQHSFDFTKQPDERHKEIQRWVEHHNQQVVDAAKVPYVTAGSLLSAIDGNQAKTNAVYLLRTVLGQTLRKSVGSGVTSSKKLFLRSLRGEMILKRSSQDPRFIIRDVLIKTQTM